MTALLTDLGPFFAVETHPAGATPQAPWRPLDELVQGGPVLRDRVDRVRHLLAAGRPDDAVELRVAASVTHLGIVARLFSPAFAYALETGAVLDLADTWWQPVDGGAVPLSIRDSATDRAGNIAVLLVEQVIDGVIRMIGEAAAKFSLSEQILWGNVASAVNGSARMLTAGRPTQATTIRATASAVLAQRPLAGTSTVQDGHFRRRSCCLIYRAAPDHNGPICGDCVLTTTRES
ncbi:(2Fe-2S)-binding protein [Amycolatopsis sp. NPDC048633]|uniref:(2Fe-2S)-binding protein n=1 Tax=Amycolatopsis sp. NPDC048633 TaxID=3157095 RepID=UPI0033E139E2